jgi:hypothetical protein
MPYEKSYFKNCPKKPIVYVEKEAFKQILVDK